MYYHHTKEGRSRGCALRKDIIYHTKEGRSRGSAKCAFFGYALRKYIFLRSNHSWHLHISKLNIDTVVQNNKCAVMDSAKLNLHKNSYVVNNWVDKMFCTKL
eukprot:TRINITY_DN39030_c1_g1_i1.p1 TRINITY_DN39030_c1_g1~~TRINITY_DN39030_c1_g1_i1.p1  ORF type:complete len:102 (+),score=10.56 TRINITY_DN39030_c1_g1_i1:203-508(+)